MFTSIESILIKEAVDIRYLIWKHYRNPDRAMTERVLSRMYNDITAAEIRRVVFQAGQQGLFAKTMGGWGLERAEPSLDDYPEIEKSGIKRMVRETAGVRYSVGSVEVVTAV